MMKKPEGLTGESVFAVHNLRIGSVRKPYYSLKRMTPLPLTVNVRVERCQQDAETVEHEQISEYLDFGITSNVWNPEALRVLFPSPGLVQPSEILEPFTPAKLVRLTGLASWHHNSMYDYCAHQKAPGGPRGSRPEPCEKTGFKYGQAWLVRPLPADFLTRLREVFADSDPDCIYDSGEDL